MSTPCHLLVSVTFRVERHLNNPTGVVFDAYADIDQRERWIVPANEALVYESHDFRVGGSDHYLRSRRDAPRYTGTTQYELIDNHCIVFTERLVDADDQLLNISVVAWAINEANTGTHLVITDQTASVVGSRPIEGGQHRYEIMLDRLAQQLTAATTG